MQVSGGLDLFCLQRKRVVPFRKTPWYCKIPVFVHDSCVMIQILQRAITRTLETLLPGEKEMYTRT